MSGLNGISNYGGRMSDNQQGIKQFYGGGAQSVNWVYKKILNETVITPLDGSKPVLINNNLYVSKDLYVEGSIYNPSDEKLKENIQKIKSEEINNLFNLNPITFSYKNDERGLKHFGLLAQEVEQIFPELVNSVEKEYKAVNYQELVPLMLVKMKEMQNEINELKEKLDK
jgi:hypothetical protein